MDPTVSIRRPADRIFYLNLLLSSYLPILFNFYVIRDLVGTISYD